MTYDFEQDVLDAMNSFADNTRPPTFDGQAIHRRTRRGRGLAVAATAFAVIAVGTGTAFALQSPTPTAQTAAAKSAAASGQLSTGSGTPTGSGTVTATPSASAEAHSVTVPNVVGMSSAQAVTTLAAAGFPITTRTTGTVVSQNPAAGAEVAAGSTVTLVLKG
jgi:hypothetical protein